MVTTLEDGHGNNKSLKKVELTFIIDPIFKKSNKNYLACSSLMPKAVSVGEPSAYISLSSSLA